MQDAGYISISAPDPKGYVHITALEKLKPFIVNTDKDSIILELGNFIIDEITGITDAPKIGTNTKQVKYTAHVEPNELAKIFELPLECKFNVTLKMSKVFKKYDDGWRVE